MADLINNQKKYPSIRVYADPAHIALCPLGFDQSYSTSQESNQSIKAAVYKGLPISYRDSKKTEQGIQHGWRVRCQWILTFFARKT